MKMLSCNLKNVVVKRPLQTAFLMSTIAPGRVRRGGFWSYMDKHIEGKALILQRNLSCIAFLFSLCIVFE